MKTKAEDTVQAGNERSSRDNAVKDLAGKLTRDRGEGARKNLKKRWIVALVIVLLGVGTYFTWQYFKPVSVEMAFVSYQRLGPTAQPILRVSGYVTYPRISVVSTSYRAPVQQVLFDVGERVQAGQLLARFDDAELLARQRVHQVAIADLEETVRRTQNLLEGGAASQADLQQAQTRLETERANLALVDTQLEQTRVRAPFTGMVMEQLVEVGEVPQQGICRLADNSSTLVQVDISQDDISRIGPMQPAVVMLDAYPDSEYVARVDELLPTADAARNTITARVRVGAPNTLFKPNMSTKVFMVNEPLQQNSLVESALAVDPSAVMQDGNESFVWVIRRGKIQKRAVKTGPPIADQLKVLSGLRADERVVINADQYNLSEGTRVQIMEQ